MLNEITLAKEKQKKADTNRTEGEGGRRSSRQDVNGVAPFPFPPTSRTFKLN